MKRQLMAFLLLLLGSAFAVPRDARGKSAVLSVSVSRVALRAEERVVSFEINVTAGMVQSVSHVPKGWNLIVDNDASWKTKVTGNALVGAATLSPEEFQKIQLVVEKDEAYSKFAISGAASVTKDFEKERRIEFREGDFSFNSAISVSDVPPGSSIVAGDACSQTRSGSCCKQTQFGQCRVVHGRYAIYVQNNGIVDIGGKKLLITAGDGKLDEMIYQAGDWEDFALVGNFTVCPGSASRVGRRQYVCIQAYKNIKVVKRPW